MLVTLMIPAMVLIIPQYVDRDRPADPRTSTCWTRRWRSILPSVANAFNIFLLKRFFDSIPEDLMAAARIDGALAVAYTAGRSSCRCRVRFSAWSRFSR